MNNRTIVKVAKALTLLMIVSLLIPVFAFGATLGIKNYSYDKATGTVSGTVYSSDYDTVNGAVYLKVYSPDNSVLKSVYTSVYETESVNDVTYYNFSFSTGITANVYDAVYLQGEYNSSVTDKVYVQDVGVSPGGGSGGDDDGGGGGGNGNGGGSNAGVITPPTTSGSGIDVSPSGEVDPDSLKNALSTSNNVVLKLAGDKALIPAVALVDSAGKAAFITIESPNGSYILPLSALDLVGLAKSVEVDLEDLIIDVSITKVSGGTSTAVADSVYALGGTPLADPVDFTITAVGNTGKELELTDFNIYVSRTLNISKAVDSSMVTGVLFDEATKKLSFVPATFAIQDGKTVATLKRKSNSIYTVVELNKSFADVTAHWANDDVTLLANKLVVDGVTDTSFEPDRSITRAEFAALVVRSLGIKAEESKVTYFKDVNASDWYSSVVAAAAAAKLIDGYEDGTFKPNDNITREELAAIVVRALNYAGANTTLSTTQAALLSKFTDSDQIIWAQQELAVAIDAGIINGLTDTTIGSSKLATRAESATMLKRFLSKAAFIN